jgi:histidinol-phosphate aminotransferase
MEAEARVNPWIEKIEAYVPGKTLEGYVKLASNENNYGPSPNAIEAIKENAGLVYRYPYKDEEVREKTALYCGVPKENVIVGNGSDELIDLVVKTFKGPSCGVFPSFSGYKLISSINGVDYIEIPSSKDFSFPVDEFKRKTRKAKIIFLCSPNNPTGNVIPEDAIKEVLSLGKITVIDEAYYEFYGKTALDLPSDYRNLIVLRTFAKAFGLAGLRAGYALADPNVIRLLCKTKPPFNVNSLAQEAVLAALDDVSYMKRCVEMIRKDREVMGEKLGRKFRVFPSQANFVFADVRPRKSSEVFKKLLDKKIIVREFGRLSGFDGEYVRVSVGTTDENNRLYEALDGI